MIKAEELRQGNIVNSIRNNKRHTVTGILSQKVKNGIFILIYLDYDNGILSEHIFPVPLTPEILEACGFEEGKILGGILEVNINFMNLVTVQVGEIVFTTVHFLHQLQNLYYALTGKELEINAETLSMKNLVPEN